MSTLHKKVAEIRDLDDKELAMVSGGGETQCHITDTVNGKKVREFDAIDDAV